MLKRTDHWNKYIQAISSAEQQQTDHQLQSWHAKHAIPTKQTRTKPTSDVINNQLRISGIK
jgi:hypothetical protein